MALKVKYDIGTSVSIAVIVGYTPELPDKPSEPIEQEIVFLPGSVLPANTSPRLIKLFENGDEHLHSLLVDDAPAAAPVFAASPNIVAPSQTENPFDPNPRATTGTITDSNTTGIPYEEWKRIELDTEVEKRIAAGREITIVGTGANGAVKAADLVTGLKADDEAAGTVA